MEPIKSVQIKDYIAELLRNEIFSAKFSDGNELTQEIIAEKLGISRMPVREAFQMLEQEGFLERLPNRHVRVIGVTKANILHNFCVLSALETEFASLMLLEKRAILPVRQAYERYRMSVPQQGTEKCTERELEFHRQISLQLEDKYLLQLHQKILFGYLTYALKYAPSKWEFRVTALEEIVGAMENNQRTVLHDKFDAYYTEIAQSMIKGLKRERSEPD